MEVDDRGDQARVPEALDRLRTADDRELHDVGAAVIGQRIRQLARSAGRAGCGPSSRAAGGRSTCSNGSTGHLVEARDDHVVALLRHPRVEIDGRGGHALGDAVAERVGRGCSHGALVDVDRVHVRGAVAARAAPRAGRCPQPTSRHRWCGADALAEQVAPRQAAALGRARRRPRRRRAQGTAAGRGRGPGGRASAAAAPARSARSRRGPRPRRGRRCPAAVPRRASPAAAM